ncbi:hypothetical protein AX15_000802 [Amanita polypyramis BW_CC]|nr:hypothetical protein AX15_000802 [Amanita polypyramis BW_CC]
MPRAESKSLSTQLYHATGQYPPDSPSQMSDRPSSTSSSSSSTASKKKHICPTCDRAFTTSGHLARHSRVHTGERNHKCPFPGCETRCSRQDNLQQHYRIHLSPGSRRSSTRSAIARAMSSSSPIKRNTVPSPDIQFPPPPMTPPALEPARIYTHSPPPDTPPPLAPATLPMHITDPISNRSSSSPDAYSPGNHHLMSMSSNSMSLPGSQSYSYRSGTTTYQEQSQGAGFTYVHTTPLHSTSNSTNGFYSNAHGNLGYHSMPHMNSSATVIHNSRHNSEPSISGMASRHSISHISHPHSYSQAHSPSGGPPSPASSHSVSSHTSGPPTPTYPVFHDDGHTYHNGMMSNEANGHPHMGVASHALHPNNVYHQNGSQPQSSSSGALGLHAGRFTDSPPPTLAPIQDERFIRREDRHPAQSHQSHSSPPYIHHPQPMSSEYPYSQHLGLTSAGWKSENGLRKGVGALVQ